MYSVATRSPHGDRDTSELGEDAGDTVGVSSAPAPECGLSHHRRSPRAARDRSCINCPASAPRDEAALVPGPGATRQPSTVVARKEGRVEIEG